MNTPLSEQSPCTWLYHQLCIHESQWQYHDEMIVYTANIPLTLCHRGLFLASTIWWNWFWFLICNNQVAQCHAAGTHCWQSQAYLGLMALAFSDPNSNSVQLFNSSTTRGHNPGHWHEWEPLTLQHLRIPGETLKFQTWMTWEDSQDKVIQARCSS